MNQRKGRPSRSVLYGECMAALRNIHHEEFEAMVTEAYAEHGYRYQRRLSAEERAEAKRLADEAEAKELIAGLVARHGLSILDGAFDDPAPVS